MYIVLDTNILLLDANNLVTIANSYDNPTIVLPETVLDEIDSKKSGFSEIAFQARQFGRLLATADTVSIDQYDDYSRTVLDLNGISIHVIAIDNYPSFKDTASNIINDRKIIYTASKYNRRFSDTIFISNDVMCRIRAQAEGLTVIDYKLVSDLELEFVKALEVPSNVFPLLHNMAITSVDTSHKPENYNYIFIDRSTKQRKLATIQNGNIQVIGRETEKDLRAQDLPPINTGQLFLTKAILDPLIDIVVTDAKAGSGKTATAISNAIKLVRNSKTPYDSIVYIRSSINDEDKGEDIGYLAGNDEKLALYLHPLEDTLEVIARHRLANAKCNKAELEVKVLDTIEKIRAQCNIQGIITLGLRGRTLRNCVVIVDEVANLSKASLQKVLTRVGENCKVILIGSNKQIDNPYLNKYTNGLSTILNACRSTSDVVKLHAVELPRVVRGKIAEFAEDIFSQ